MKLIIVESPAKCKTLQKYVDDLGDYVVLASAGHIREIAKNGIDEKNNFKTKYTKIRGKAKYINQLKASASNADEVIIATDADREGHAIGWHIAKVLDLNVKTTKRIIFHEITKKAIQVALENPTTIDMKQVNSQKGRSVLDRLIGFKFSPLLWKHVQNKLSAGRVQSVATRLIVDKENEILNLAQFCREKPDLKLVGLMTMAPFTDDEKKIRKSFSELRKLKDKLNNQGFDLKELSMGMTNDFEIAIEEGATMLRIGSAIFGQREYSKDWRQL